MRDRCREARRSLTTSWRWGFTLMEMLTVLAVLTVLVALAGTVWYGRSEQAVRNGALVNVRTLATALRMYQTDNQRFPGEFSGWAAAKTQLGRYTEITRLERSFPVVQFIDVAAAGSRAKCVYVELNLDPTYFITSCLESTNTTARWNISNQPTCCWAPSGCGTPSVPGPDTDWYKCEEKL